MQGSAIDKVVAVVEALDEPRQLSDITQLTGLVRQTIRAILKHLDRLGWVERVDLDQGRDRLAYRLTAHAGHLSADKRAWQQPQLSPQELEVLGRLARGYEVDGTVAALLGKLGAYSEAHAVAIGYEHGLLRLGDAGGYK